MMNKSKIEIWKDVRGEWRFRFKARNGKIVAVSEGYKRKGACLRGINAVDKILTECKEVSEVE